MLAASIWQSIFGMPQIAIVMGCLIPISSIAFGYWFKAQKVQSENRLKKSMVERGMSAEEIERILAAGTEDGSEDD